jgi:micrococcal nuclease
MDTFTRKVVKVNRIVDGDTVELVVDLGYTITVTDRFRMDGYDAPETFRPRIKGEREAGLMVKSFLEDILYGNKDKLFVQTRKTGKYGRYIATVFIEGGVKTVNILVEEYMRANALTKEDLKAKENEEN